MCVKTQLCVSDFYWLQVHSSRLTFQLFVFCTAACLQETVEGGERLKKKKKKKNSNLLMQMWLCLYPVFFVWLLLLYCCCYYFGSWFNEKNKWMEVMRAEEEGRGELSGWDRQNWNKLNAVPSGRGATLAPQPLWGLHASAPQVHAGNCSQLDLLGTGYPRGSRTSPKTLTRPDSFGTVPVEIGFLSTRFHGPLSLVLFLFCPPQSPTFAFLAGQWALRNLCGSETCCPLVCAWSPVTNPNAACRADEEGGGVLV